MPLLPELGSCEWSGSIIIRSCRSWGTASDLPQRPQRSQRRFFSFSVFSVSSVAILWGTRKEPRPERRRCSGSRRAEFGPERGLESILTLPGTLSSPLASKWLIRAYRRFFNKGGLFSCFASSAGLLPQRHRGTEGRNLRSQMFRNPGVVCPGQSSPTPLRDPLLLELGNSFRFATEGTEITEEFFISDCSSRCSLCPLWLFLKEQITPARPALGSAPAGFGRHKFFFSFRLRLKAGVRGKERPLLEAFFSLLPRVQLQLHTPIRV
jgi:hypothetical protein